MDEHRPTRNGFVGLALGMSAAVARYAGTARMYYYAVVLSGHACPRCDGELAMVREGRCSCVGCGAHFDPTVAFQRCTACGGAPRIRVRRYECRHCAAEIVSRFLFDGLVFDAEYFRQKMAESRERKAAQREQILERLTECRSHELPLPPADLDGIPGLLAALNSLAPGAAPAVELTPRQRFDLGRYEAHVRAHCGTIAIRLDEIPPLADNLRLDRVWRFIAVVFLAHAGEVRAWQEGPNILVVRCETDREGQDVHGDPEAAHGSQRAFCRAEA